MKWVITHGMHTLTAFWAETSVQNKFQVNEMGYYSWNAHFGRILGRNFEKNSHEWEKWLEEGLMVVCPHKFINVMIIIK